MASQRDKQRLMAVKFLGRPEVGPAIWILDKYISHVYKARVLVSLWLCLYFFLFFAWNSFTLTMEDLRFSNLS